MSSRKPLLRPRRGTATKSRAALLGDDAVHGVGRGRDDGHGALAQEGAGGQVQRLVGAGRRQQLVRGDAVGPAAAATSAA